MGTAVAPAKHIDLVGDQLSHGNCGNLLFAGVLPPAFEGSHGTLRKAGTKKNITRTFAMVNGDRDLLLQTIGNEPRSSARNWKWFKSGVGPHKYGGCVLLADRNQTRTPFDSAENVGETGILTQPYRAS